MYDNVALTRQAMSHLYKPSSERKPEDIQPFLDLLADDAVFEVTCPADTPVYGAGFRGKDRLARYFLEEDPGIVSEVEMQRPLEYFSNGDRVVVLGAESYKLVDTGAFIGPIDFAMVFDFRDGKITRYLHIEDMTEFVNAYLNR